MLGSLILAAALAIPVGDSEPTWAPDSVRLAYVRRSAAGADIYAGVPDRRPTRLTRGDGYNTSPAWSPDGRRIAFIRGSSDGKRSSLMLMDRTGRNKRVLARNVFSRASWSRDGSQLAFKMDYRLWTLEMTTGVMRNAGLVRGSGPAWSPDGELVALARDCVLDVVELASGRTTPGDQVIACLFGGPRVSLPAWSPDGTRIAFGHCEGLLNCKLVLAPRIPWPTSTWLKTQVPIGPDLAWSPDGRRLAFSCVRNDRSGLVIWNLDRRGLLPTC